MQLSAVVGSQVAHICPGAPHAVVLSAVVQLVPLQHPDGHEVTSHTQAPLTQCCPAAHGAPLPHWHAPLLQLSVRTESQAIHAIAPVPHEVTEGGETQVDPLQQPVVQVAAQPEHTPPVHDWPPGHCWQSSPPAPHAPAELPATHALFEQQPLGQETPSQMHRPPEQRCPPGHSAVEPHIQPRAPQLSAVSGSHCTHMSAAAPQLASDGVLQVLLAQQPESQMVSSQTQPLVVQCWRGPHAGSLPQRQWPSAEQVSAAMGSQVTHVSPPEPQLESERGWHWPSMQHPDGQVVASQTQTPAAQRCPSWQVEVSPPQTHEPVAEQVSALNGSQAAQA